MGHGHMQVQVADVHGGLLDALHAAHGLKVQLVQGFAGNLFVGGAQRGLHHAAGGAEDGGGAGALAQQLVKALVGQVEEIDARLLDHARQLPGGHHGIHIRQAVDGCQLLAVGLKLLGRAGHNGYHRNVLGLDALLLRVVALDHGAGHLVGRLAAGQVGDEIREIGLAIVDPAGGTGGNHGQHAALGDALHQLVGFLHDGEVGTEIGIKHAVKAQAAQRGCQLAHHVGAHGQAKLLAQARAHGGRGLHHHMLVGVGQQVPHQGGFLLLAQGAHRAGGDALAAGDAGHAVERQIPRRGDGGIKAAFHRADDAHGLRFVAGGHAAAAEDALVVVAHDGGGFVIYLVLVALALKLVAVFHAQLQRQLLQFAVLATHAAEALFIVVGENQLQNHLARLAYLGRVGAHHHAVARLQHAGRLQGAAAGVHHAHAAGANLVQILEEAQRGDTDLGLTRCLQHRGALGHNHLHVVDGQCNV